MTLDKKTKQLIKLSQNENPYGTSDLAIKAIEDNYHLIHRYPEDALTSLKNKLLQKHHIPHSNITIGAGSIEIIDIMIRTFVNADENVVIPKITFVAYPLLSKLHKRECRLAEMDNYTTDINKIIEICDNKTKVIFIANPNNPTGTMISHDALYDLLKALPPHIYVVIDEAYAEYVTSDTYPDTGKLMKEFSNLIILRTFSKIYGLAGLRIGYAITNETIAEKLKSKRIPFSVNVLAPAAAFAALDDTEFIESSARKNTKERAYLYKELKAMDFNVIPSESNFLYICFQGVQEKENIYNRLLEHGLLIRNMDLFGDPKALRISIGDHEHNEELINHLYQIKKESGIY